MPGTEGFLELAGIGGVFVGFAALIAVRSGSPIGDEIAYMRGVVTIGMLAIVAALAPASFGRFGLPEHAVWALSSGVALIGEIVLFSAMARTPEYRANFRSEMHDAATQSSWRSWTAVGVVAYLLFMAAVVLTPIVILAGVVPELEAALFFTLVVLLLLGAGWALLELVFTRRSDVGA